MTHWINPWKDAVPVPPDQYLSPFLDVATVLAWPETSKGWTSVSLDVYAGYWRTRGAKIGRIIKGAIKWE